MTIPDQDADVQAVTRAMGLHAAHASMEERARAGRATTTKAEWTDLRDSCLLFIIHDAPALARLATRLDEQERDKVEFAKRVAVEASDYARPDLLHHSCLIRIRDWALDRTGLSIDDQARLLAHKPLAAALGTGGPRASRPKGSVSAVPPLSERPGNET